MSQRHTVGPLASLPPGTGKAFVVAGQKLAFFNVEGRIFAIDDRCPHDGASLAEGALEGTTIVCPWHAAQFDVTNGTLLCAPAEQDVKSYPVFVQGDDFGVEL